MSRRMISSRKFRGIAGDKWLMKLEKKAFGWKYWSLENEHEYGYEISSDGLSGHTTHKVIQWLEFRRQTPFTHNFLFKFAEFLDNIFSFIRRILISIGTPVLVIALILGLVCTYGCDAADFGGIALKVAMWLAISYAISAAVTLLLSGLGLLWRKVFGIDKKLEKIYGDLNDCRFHDED